MADAMEMDWKPTTPPRYPTHNPYRDPYYVPGGWPESPPDTSTSWLSQKRKRDGDEEATPAVKRVCKKLVACKNNTVEYIASYRIVQAVRRKLSRSANRQNRSEASQALSVSQNTIAYSSLEDRFSNRDRTDKIHKGLLTLEIQAPRRRLPLNYTPQSSKSRAEFLHEYASAPSMSNPIIRKRAKWSGFALVSTKQLPLPTPEPDPAPEPELVPAPELESVSAPVTLPELKPMLQSEALPDTGQSSEKSKSVDIFSNMPDLRPSVLYEPLTPDTEQDIIQSVEVEQEVVFSMDKEPYATFGGEESFAGEASLLTNKSFHADGGRSDTGESSYQDDSPSAQLHADLKATFEESDTMSETSSKEINPAWVRNRVMFAPEVVVIPAEDAPNPSIMLYDSSIEPPKFTPPSFRLRSPSSLSSTPAKTIVVSPETKSASSDKQVSSPETVDPYKTPTKVQREQQNAPVDDVIIIPDSSTNLAPEDQIANLTIQDESPSKPETPKAGFHAAEKLRRLTRQRALKELQLQEALNEYEIVPLTEEWDKKVRSAVKQGFGNYSSSDLARVVPQYASRGQDNWLNDESINGYLDLIVAHGKKNDRETQTPSHHAFNSFFYSNLTAKGLQSVVRWSKRAKISGKELLKVEKIFIPINSSAHWTLAVVEGTKKRIVHYNSLQSASRGTAVCNHIKKWVAMELGSAFKEEEWTIETVGKSPQQTNSDDCGIFTITSARQIMLGFDPTSYQPNQIQTQRKRIVAELIAGALIKSKE